MNKTIELGSEWPHHYRGTKYHYNEDQKIWWQTFKDGLRVYVKTGHENIIKEILPLKTQGSFRITEIGDIIAKVESEKDKWVPKFVCEMDEPFKFVEAIDITPADIQPGDLWPGFYDGARYSYIIDKVWWNNPDGPRQYIKQKLPDDVMIQLRKLKPAGGSFRITENGYVLALIPKQPLPNNIKKQWEKLSVTQQQIIAAKVENTDMLPVYIGRYYEGIDLEDPKDYSKPLTPSEKKKMLDFLGSYSISNEFDGMVPKDVDKEKLGEEFRDDPEDWA